MNWLLVAIVAQFILGTTAVFDKALLTRKFFDPWVYTFWSVVLGLIVIFLLPFGYTPLPSHILVLALVGGAFFTFASLLFFFALEKGEASVAQPTLIALAQIFTLIFATYFLQGQLGKGGLISFFTLVVGGLFFIRAERRDIRFSLFAYLAFSGIFFGAFNVITKIVFEQGSFIAGLFWMRIGAFLTVLIPLLRPAFRSTIVRSFRESAATNKILYVGNRVYGSFGFLLVQGAISLASPVLVDATSSLKIMVSFFGAWILLRERFRGKVLYLKILATLLVMLGILGLSLASYSKSISVNPNRSVGWGITFSDKFAKQLGLDSQETLGAILDDLKPKKLRLVAYWDEIESKKGIYDFESLDWQLNEAKEHGADVILVIGMKVPRWPECHVPGWVVNLAVEEREKALRSYIQELILHYRSRPEISMWQVENEPYLMFGSCPIREPGFLGQEIAVAKSLDSVRPILTTDGGELGLWYKAAREGDVFGTTMYRQVYPRFIGPLLGPIEYPIGPSYFRIKERLVRRINNDFDKKFIVIELQGEPWGKVLLPDLPVDEQYQLYSPDYFRDTIHYALNTGFEEYYWWGVEWWYWMKVRQGDTRYWEIAQDLFAQYP